jgi:hypothetical protein
MFKSYPRDGDGWRRETGAISCVRGAPRERRDRAVQVLFAQRLGPLLAQPSTCLAS